MNGQNWVSFAAVKAAVAMRTVLPAYGVKELRGSGRQQYRGRCPIHGGEGREAFHVNLDKNVFHCFACGAGGNVLDFVAAMERCSVREAALWLQGKFFFGGAAAVSLRRESRTPEEKLVTKKREGNAPLRFSLSGLDPLHPYVGERGLTPETAGRFGVGYYAGPGLLSQRLAIPIHDQHGRLVAYCGRSLGTAEPRYKFPPGFRKSAALFNYHRAIRAAGDSDSVVVVEGFFDCMRVDQAGFRNVVALMGAALSPAQEMLLVSRFRRVLLMLDGDETGRVATRGILARLASQCAIRDIVMPRGSQPDQMSEDEIRRALMSP
jgi:DNA primase